MGLSLSARRAWIEIFFLVLIQNHDTVALRKESVDRNTITAIVCHPTFGSLSARRAWIEMRMVLFPAPPTMVALRKESVDRNAGTPAIYTHTRVALRKESVDRNATGLSTKSISKSRSPQGERG